MPRPQRNRRICREPIYREFGPVEQKGNSEVILTLDEFEAVRMVDYVGLTHEQCASHMRISRTTVTEVYERARKKIADALVNGKKLLIDGGNYSICENASKNCLCGMLNKTEKSSCKE